MSERLSSFLRVIASTLSPQAAAANTQLHMQEMANERAQEEEDFKLKMGQIGLYATIAKENPNNPKIQYEMGKKIRMAAGGDTRILNSAMGYITEGRDGRISTIFEGAGKAEKATTELTKLQEQRSRLEGMEQTPSVIRQISEIDKRINKLSTITGTTAEDLKRYGTKATNDLQTSLINTRNAIDRIRKLKQDFDPKYTKASTKAGVALSAFSEKIGVPISQASEKELAEYTDYARTSLENTNQHIRERTGAVMNNTEVPRLMGEMPTIGTGIFDGDSATQFKTKIDSVLETLEAAEQRYLYALENGYDVSDPENFTRNMPLDDFKGLPQKPKNIEQKGWDKMSPQDRRDLVRLLEAKKKRNQ